jgi:curved DNA-binding protein CbpA
MNFVFLFFLEGKSMDSVKDRKKFKRYSHLAEFQIPIGGITYQAYTNNFSLNDICFTIKGMPTITSGTAVDIKIEELNLDIQGKVLWTKKNGLGFTVDVERRSISGLLKHFPLSDIFLDLQRNEKTGILEVKDGNICKKIYIKNGDITFAASNLEEDRLGEVLIKAGRLTLEQYSHSFDVMKKTGKRHGSVLVELGYLKPKEVFLAVTNQVEEIILSLFQWKEGRFEFKEGPLPSEEVITLKLSAANLIYRGCKRMDNITNIRNTFPPMDAILYYSKDPLNLFQDIKLYEKDKEIVSLIDGSRTLQEIFSMSPLNNFETVKTLHALISARIIEIHEKDEMGDKIGEEVLRETEEVVLDSSFVEKVEELYNKLESSNYYELLEVTKWSTADDIKRAYYKKAKEFHPDRHFYLTSNTLKNKLDNLFSTLTIAYKTLSDLKMKKEYDESLSSRTLPGTGRNLDMAKAKFEEGKMALKKRLFADAAALFGQAVYLDNSVPDYHFYLGLTLENEKKLHEAEDAVNKALKLAPFNALYMAELGHIYLELGLNLRAKTTFEKAIKFDPSNERATEGLQKLAGRS